jgi:hypothetical protein
LELSVVVVVAAMWLVGAAFLASWMLALRYAWVLLS